MPWPTINFDINQILFAVNEVPKSISNLINQLKFSLVSSLLPVFPDNCNGIVQSYSNSASSRMNTIINFVPHQEAWVIERMGRYVKTLSPVNIFIPI